MLDFNEVIDRNHTNAIAVEGPKRLFDEKKIAPGFQGDLIAMGIADMNFSTPDFIRDAIKSRLDQKILGYTKLFDTKYYDVFNDWLKRQYNWQIKPDQLQLSPGIVPALYQLVELLTKPNEKILIFTPSYGYFQKAVTGCGRELVCCDLLDDDGCYTINYQEIEQLIQDERISMCIFCNPHNPTGRLWQKDELERLGKLLIEKNIWIISDEIHCDLLRTEKRHLPFAKLFPDYSRIITCMSPSKTFNLAGLMLGNVIIPDEMARALWQVKNNGLVNPLAVAGVQAAYSQGADYLEQLKSYLDQNFKLLDRYLQEHLPKAKHRIPEATYLAWIDVSAYLESGQTAKLVQMLVENTGVVVGGADHFVQNGHGHIRINLALPQKRLLEGLERICVFLTELANKKV